VVEVIVVEVIVVEVIAVEVIAVEVIVEDSVFFGGETSVMVFPMYNNTCHYSEGQKGQSG